MIFQICTYPSSYVPVPYNMVQTVSVYYIPYSEVGFYVNYKFLEEERLGWLEIGINSTWTYWNQELEVTIIPCWAETAAKWMIKWSSSISLVVACFFRLCSSSDCLHLVVRKHTFCFFILLVPWQLVTLQYVCLNEIYKLCEAHIMLSLCRQWEGKRMCYLLLSEY
jgi:hypothetical protein